MKDIRHLNKAILIALIVSFSSQLYFYFLTDNFRISAAVILFPILLMTIAQDQSSIFVGCVTGIMVFIIRLFLIGSDVSQLQDSLSIALIGGLFYVAYVGLFSLIVGNKHTVSFQRLILGMVLSDFCSNIFEIVLRSGMNYDNLNAHVYFYLLVIASVRAIIAGSILLGEQNYRALVKKMEHENRYQRLYLMTTRLKNESYFMEKNTEEIESAMSNAYRLYERLSDLDVHPELKKTALSIARDVHEIKKDYIRIMQGIQKEVDEQFNDEKMETHDLLQILKESAYRTIKAKHLNIQLIFQILDKFVTRNHYSLMLILMNLVNNGIEAIEKKGCKGQILVRVKKEDGQFVFTVTDNGSGIPEKNIDHIFQMGFSTKFDEATGNIYRGVGLSGVQMTVEEQFHGTIHVKSELGAGTEFCVIIPAKMLEKD
jgi:two-component system sensor histidine kinase YcbA